MAGDAEVMLEEFLQSAVTAGEKQARTAYAKAGLALLGGLWQSEAASGQLRRLLPGLLYQVLSLTGAMRHTIECFQVMSDCCSLQRYCRGDPFPQQTFCMV